MRRMIRVAIICMCVVVFLSACGGSPQPTAAPPTQQPQVIQPPTSAPVMDAPTPTQLIRETLPPEWTLTPAPTSPGGLAQPVGTPIPTFDMINAVLLTSPTRETCDSFQIQYDQTTITFQRGTDARVAWTQVSDALAYRVTLYNENRDTVYTAIVGEQTFSFGATLFTLPQRYFWEVRPFDRDGNQLCAAVGAILIPTN